MLSDVMKMRRHLSVPTDHELEFQRQMEFEQRTELKTSWKLLIAAGVLGLLVCLIRSSKKAPKEPAAIENSHE